MGESDRDPYHDLPVPELVRRARKWIMQGWVVYFTWTCEKCGSRQGFADPNILYERGKCGACGHVTEIKKGGFTLIKAVKAA